VTKKSTESSPAARAASGAARAVGRPRGFDTDQVLRRAMERFWAAGYRGTSTSDLETATGLSRSSLTNTFGDKRTLFLAALDVYQAAVTATLTDPLRHGSDGLESIATFFDDLAALKLDEPGCAGCLMINSAAEFGQQDAQITDRVAAYEHDLHDAFRVALTRAAELGQIAPEDRDDRASLLVSLALTINQAARALGSDSVRRYTDSASHLLQTWQASTPSSRGG
jgi:AcrR family transcriptional regulator